MSHRLEVESEHRKFLSIELLVGWEAHFLEEIVHGNPLLGATNGLFTEIGILVSDHVPHVSEEKAFATRVQSGPLLLVKVQSLHCSEMQEDHDEEIC